MRVPLEKTLIRRSRGEQVSMEAERDGQIGARLQVRHGFADGVHRGLLLAGDTRHRDVIEETRRAFEHGGQPRGIGGGGGQGGLDGAGNTPRYPSARGKVTASYNVTSQPVIGIYPGRAGSNGTTAPSAFGAVPVRAEGQQVQY